MSSPSPPSCSFGDSLLCPVCFEMFEGRILQCTQGHSVCERCQRKLNNECPQCRGTFAGTRNYILEEMVKQLKNLKMATIKGNNKNIGQSPANSSATNDKLDGEDDSKLTEAIAKLVASIPKPSTKPVDERSNVEPAIVPNALDRDRIAFESIIAEDLLLNDLDDVLNRLQMVPSSVPLSGRGPPQPKGLFECRMNCNEKLPICRMVNHVRCFHVKHLTETRLLDGDDEFVMHYSFPCNNFRQAIRVAQYGLFFFIVNVKKEQGKTIITSWVQCVGRAEECKLYTFNLQMRIGDFIAHYTDYTYGNSSSADYIELKKQCLTYEAQMAAKRIKKIAVDVKITKAVGARTGRRRNTTTVTPIERPL